MATQYTSLLGLALPVTGELSGSWGDTVNDAITSLLDTAVAGTTSITTDADITLTTTTGVANQARQAIILWNPASGTTTRNITAPAQSKIYTVINASGGTQSIVFRGAGPTTGVTIVKGESAVVAWNGTDFIKISNAGGSASFTNVTVSGTTTLSGLTASTALALDASKNVVSVTNTGTGNNVLSASPTLTGTLAAAAATFSGNVTLGDATTDTVTVNGYMGVGGAAQANIGVWVRNTALVNTAQYGVQISPVGTSAATSQIAGAYIAPATAAAAFTVTNVYGAFFANATLGAGSTITTLYGIQVADQTVGTTNVGIASLVSSGTNKWNIYASGTAANYFAGNVQFAAGSAAAPALTRFGDDNTGIFFPAADTIAFAEGGAESMRLDSAGNLGIGTTSPSGLLDASSGIYAIVMGADSGVKTRTDATQKLGRFGGYHYTNAEEPVCLILSSAEATNNIVSVGGGTSNMNTATQLRFFTAATSTTLTGTERMRIDSAGNVGIGATSPYSLLDVAQASATANLTLRRLATVIGSGLYQGQLQFGAYTTGTTTEIGSAIRGESDAAWTSTSAAGRLMFYTTASGSTTPTERMRLDSSGNLGLGVTPSAWNGTWKAFQIAARGAVSSEGTVLDVTLNSFANVSAVDTYLATATATKYRQQGGTHQWFNAPSGTAGTAITFTQAMTLDTSGRLGIGTTSPSLPLHIFAGTNNTNVARFTGAQLNRGLTISTYSSDSVNDGGAGFSADFSMRFTTNAIVREVIDSAGNVQTLTGAQVVWAPAPASISTTATLTNANIQGQIINTTGTSYTVTMPLGTTLETLVSWVTVDLGYDFTVINTASGTITMAVNTGVTSLGGLTIATGVSAQFRIRRTAANTFILYRLS